MVFLTKALTTPEKTLPELAATGEVQRAMYDAYIREFPETAARHWYKYRAPAPPPEAAPEAAAAENERRRDGWW